MRHRCCIPRSRIFRVSPTPILTNNANRHCPPYDLPFVSKWVLRIVKICNATRREFETAQLVNCGDYSMAIRSRSTVTHRYTDTIFVTLPNDLGNSRRTSCFYHLEKNVPARIFHISHRNER